jgi:hypothetical protein
MKPTFRNTFASLWSRPDPVLAQASVAGELLVAKIRLGLATVLLIIPVINTLFFPVEPKEAIVGVSLTSATFFLSLPDLAGIQPVSGLQLFASTSLTWLVVSAQSCFFS